MNRTSARPARLPSLFALGFRPFFLLAGIWGAVVMPLWVLEFSGAIRLPLAFDAVAWHAHELLFGYAMAAVAGFLLTAVPNWTGRLPVRGWPLAVLAGLWLAGRCAMLTGNWLGPPLASGIDIAFPVALALVALREILAGRNWRNLPVLLALSLLVLASGLSHAAQLGLPVEAGAGQRLGIATLAGLMALVGGRITPSFTRNWLAKQGDSPLPAPFGGLDRLALVATCLALAAWVLRPDGPGVAGLLGIAAALLLFRLGRWQGLRTLAEPLVSVLHLGYLWLPLGLMLLALPALTGGLAPGPASHGLTVGAVGTMTLAVMTRATLGHSGRPLHAGAGTGVVYLLISAAALGRVLAWLLQGGDTALLHLSATCWTAAFALFVLLYAPLMLAPRRRSGTGGVQ